MEGRPVAALRAERSATVAYDAPVVAPAPRTLGGVGTYARTRRTSARRGRDAQGRSSSPATEALARCRSAQGPRDVRTRAMLRRGLSSTDGCVTVAPPGRPASQVSVHSTRERSTEGPRAIRTTPRPSGAGPPAYGPPLAPEGHPRACPVSSGAPGCRHAPPRLATNCLGEAYASLRLPWGVGREVTYGRRGASTPAASRRLRRRGRVARAASSTPRDGG